jgi:hypothetical protein
MGGSDKQTRIPSVNKNALLVSYYVIQYQTERNLPTAVPTFDILNYGANNGLSASLMLLYAVLAIYT